MTELNITYHNNFNITTLKYLTKVAISPPTKIPLFFQELKISTETLPQSILPIIHFLSHFSVFPSVNSQVAQYTALFQPQEFDKSDS